MKTSKRGARRALLAALGVVVTATSTFISSAAADDLAFKFNSQFVTPTNYAEPGAWLLDELNDLNPGNDVAADGESLPAPDPDAATNASEEADAAGSTEVEDAEAKSEPMEGEETGDEEAEESSDADAGDEDSEDEDSDDSDLEDRFKELDERFAELEESIDDVAAVAGNKSIVVSGSSKSTMKVSGRVHFDAWGFDSDGGAEQEILEGFNDGLEPQNRLGFRRLRFGVKGKVKDNMVYKIESEFAGGNDVEFRDAYLGWSDLPVLQKVLLGNQKRPYGLDHLNSSRFNVFLERPFVIEGFNQDARRLGLQSYGVSDDLAYNWRYGVFNQRNVQGLGNYIDDHLQLEVAGRFANTIWYDDISGGRGYAHWAVSGTHADSTDTAQANEARFRTRPEARSSARWLNTGRIAGADHYELLGLEGVVNVGAFQVVGEYQSVWMSRDAGFADTRFDGGYVYVSYFLTGEHMPWERDSGTLGRIIPFQNFWMVDRCDGCRDAGWGAWQLAARYSQADYSDEDVLGGEGEALTLGLNWYWNPNARMQFNYIHGEISNRDVGAGAQAADYDIYGARFMIDF